MVGGLRRRWLRRRPLRTRLAATGKQFYVMAFTIRSGSSVMCEDLTQWGLGAPSEWIQLPGYPVLGQERLSDYLVNLAETSPGEYFGIKMNWEQVDSTVAYLRREGESDVTFDLNSIFPNPKVLYVDRCDIISQAVSAWRAGATGVWHVRVDEAVDPGHPEFDFAGILHQLKTVLVEKRLWDSHFEAMGIEPLRVHYEDYVASRSEELLRICRFLGWAGAPSTIEEKIRVMRDDDWTPRMEERTTEHLRELFGAAPGCMLAALDAIAAERIT
jgi:LPS sulfotransferase NodH